jgi:hypothetical protein
MKIHELKTVQPYFDRVWNNQKSFELRRNDRDFQAGDKVQLQEYDSDNKEYSGRLIEGTILYVLQGFVGIEQGYCVFSIEVHNCVS